MVAIKLVDRFLTGTSERNIDTLKKQVAEILAGAKSSRLARSQSASGSVNYSAY